MSTTSPRPHPFDQYSLGFLTNPTGYVVRVYPPSQADAEITFVPLLQNGQEQGRWQQRWLTGEQYQQLVDAVRQILDPTPACEVSELPAEMQQATAETSPGGASDEGKVS